jgi:hypothetical protein
MIKIPGNETWKSIINFWESLYFIVIFSCFLSIYRAFVGILQHTIFLFKNQNSSINFSPTHPKKYVNNTNISTRNKN